MDRNGISLVNQNRFTGIDLAPPSIEFHCQRRQRSDAHRRGDHTGTALDPYVERPRIGRPLQPGRVDMEGPTHLSGPVQTERENRRSEDDERPNVAQIASFVRDRLLH